LENKNFLAQEDMMVKALQKVPPITGTPFKTYNPNRIPVVHRRSPIQDAPSMISGKLYPAPKERK
jgi:hypothetical protein